MHRRYSSASPARAVECVTRPGSELLSQSMRNGHQKEMRFFNTAGPVVARSHYCIPPLERIDLEYVLGLIDDQDYFILHAPGKPARLRHSKPFKTISTAVPQATIAAYTSTSRVHRPHAKTWDGRCGRFWGGLPRAHG